MKKRFLATTLLSAMLATSVFSGCGCSGPTSTSDEAVETSVQTVTEIATDEQGNTYVTEATKVVEVKETQGSSDASESSVQPTTQAAKTNSKSNGNASSSTAGSSSKKSNASSSSGSSASSSKTSSGVNTTNSSSSKSNSSSSSSGSSNSGKTWHEAVTKNVWVVDKEAYTYEETVFEERIRTICNACGADITDITLSEHGQYHIKNGDWNKFSYGDKWIWYDSKTDIKATDAQLKIIENIYVYNDEHNDTLERSLKYNGICYYDTVVRIITVPEEGHWETKIIKEAGYY